ncbi:MAG: preprotein translocase subunit TatB [Cycloclasticus sp. symbiont of Poecilosclerida sp. N]|nr:MAG: preprotein translocase subunit TatB [Cycloclasticus sp. symbiont of Poecilosclerida sp. N]
MFDIGFFEICLIGVIALLLIGPEKLPRAARTAGLLLGKARGMVKNVKYEIDEQIRAEELKESLAQAKETLQNEVSESFEDVETSFENLRDEVQDKPKADSDELNIETSEANNKAETPPQKTT